MKIRIKYLSRAYGEIGADIELVDRFIEMGIDELSVSPGMVLPIRKLIRESEK